MSSRKPVTAKAKSASAANTKKTVAKEPTRDEKAAFVKAMLHGIEPGSAAAKKSAAKRAGVKTAGAKKVGVKKSASKKTSTKKAASKKTAKHKMVKAAPPAANDLDQPKVEILRKISAPPKVKSTPKSTEILKLAKEIEKALEKGDLDFVQPHAVQALMMALCKFYAANDEADNIYPILPGRLAVSGTDAMVVCGALLRAVDLQVFELGMFQSWSGR